MTPVYAGCARQTWGSMAGMNLVLCWLRLALSAAMRSGKVSSSPTMPSVAAIWLCI
jgi:hypothetical protein